MRLTEKPAPPWPGQRLGKGANRKFFFFFLQLFFHFFYMYSMGPIFSAACGAAAAAAGCETGNCNSGKTIMHSTIVALLEISLFS